MAEYPRIRPPIPDPYPGEFEEVTDFRYEIRLVLAREPEALLMREEAEVSYIVDQDYRVSFKVDGVDTPLIVPRGMLTDLSSVPSALRSFVGRVGPHLEVSIVHDFLFIAWQLLDGREARREDFRFANAVMSAGLDEADVGWFQRTAIKAAINLPLIAWSLYRERDDDPEGNGLFVDLDNPI